MVCCAAAALPVSNAPFGHKVNFAFTEDGCGALRKIVRLHMAEHSAHICLTSDAVSAFMRAQRHEMTRQLYDDESLRPLLSYFFSLRA